MRMLVLLGDEVRIAGLEFGHDRVGRRQRPVLLRPHGKEPRRGERGCVNESHRRLLSEVDEGWRVPSRYLIRIEWRGASLAIHPRWRVGIALSCSRPTSTVEARPWLWH